MNYPMPKKTNTPITKDLPKKKSKYKNRKVTIDKITFPSKKEADRYLILKDKERNGEIADLRLQVKYELQPSFKVNGKVIRAINYIADFVYDEKGFTIVEDTKGFKTKEYLIKRKLFAYKYNFEITEV